MRHANHLGLVIIYYRFIGHFERDIITIRLAVSAFVGASNQKTYFNCSECS